MRSLGQFWKFSAALLLAFVGVGVLAADAHKEGDKVTVLVTKVDNKFHVAGCSHCGKDATEIPLTETKEKYEACPDCKPTAVVYVTKSGEKYHCKTCNHAKDATETTLAAARCKHMEACKTCNPPDGKEVKVKEAKKEKSEKKVDEAKSEKVEEKKKTEAKKEDADGAMPGGRQADAK